MRDLLVIAGVSVVAICIGTLLFFFGPPSLQSDMTSTLSSDQTVSATVSYTVLEKGTNAISIPTRTNYRITTESDFKALWPMIYGVRNAPAMPTIDFSKYEVLGIFDGTHTTKGFDVAVTSIIDNAQSRVITIEHSTQNASCTKLPGTSSPFELIEVPKTTLTLRHIDVSTTLTCLGN